MNPDALRSAVASLIHELWSLKGYDAHPALQPQKYHMLFLVEHCFDEDYLYRLLLSLQHQKAEILRSSTSSA
ncbi:MAG: hypothetical protein CMR00_10130 [[Chlorobium] sp. 445]|nr:MAG: hypothetical protein CMR00_10130 [[Chlorobium] sp. 445]